MATYVTSDAHGHLRALDAALGEASPSSNDVVYVLGDMIDRGPEPLGVVELVRSLGNARVIMGNHERLMLDALRGVGEPVQGEFDLSGIDADGFLDWSCWMQNGGSTTAQALAALDPSRRSELLAWVRGLPLYACVSAGDRVWALSHAGIDPACAREWLRGRGEAADPASLTEGQVLELLADQGEEDLLWVRDVFWAEPTGLVDRKGRGVVVVAGHTPSPYLPMYADDASLDCTTADGQGKVAFVGACEATGGVADKIDVDCAAAGGHGMGRVGVLRLDDLACFYAPVEEGC